MEDEYSGHPSRDVVDERGEARQVEDVLRDGVPEHREALARVELAVRADAPHAEAEVRRDGRDWLAGPRRKRELEEVYALDEREREADEEKEDEGGEEECARRERDPEVTGERARVPSPLRAVLAVVASPDAAAHGARCAGGRVKERGHRRARWES